MECIFCENWIALCQLLSRRKCMRTLIYAISGAVPLLQEWLQEPISRLNQTIVDNIRLPSFTNPNLQDRLNRKPMRSKEFPVCEDS